MLNSALFLNFYSSKTNDSDLNIVTSIIYMDLILATKQIINWIRETDIQGFDLNLLVSSHMKFEVYY